MEGYHRNHYRTAISLALHWEVLRPTFLGNNSAKRTSLYPAPLCQISWLWQCYTNHIVQHMYVLQPLTHWGTIANILPMTFSNAFSCMKMCELWLKFHWSVFLRVQLTILLHWFRWWLGANQAPSHYLNQWWLVYGYLYASLGLNESKRLCLSALGRWATCRFLCWYWQVQLLTTITAETLSDFDPSGAETEHSRDLSQ